MLVGVAGETFRGSAVWCSDDDPGVAITAVGRERRAAGRAGQCFEWLRGSCGTVLEAGVVAMVTGSRVGIAVVFAAAVTAAAATIVT